MSHEYLCYSERNSFHPIFFFFNNYEYILTSSSSLCVGLRFRPRRLDPRWEVLVGASLWPAEPGVALALEFVLLGGDLNTESESSVMGWIWGGSGRAGRPLELVLDTTLFSGDSGVMASL